MKKAHGAVRIFFWLEIITDYDKTKTGFQMDYAGIKLSTQEVSRSFVLKACDADTGL